jgi:hypothetical protein
MVRTLVMAVALLAALGLGRAAHPAAASGGVYWGYNQATGCTFLTDGSASYLKACPRGDGWFYLYVPQNGQWVYGGLGQWDIYNCFSYWDGGSYGFTVCPPGVAGDPDNLRVILANDTRVGGQIPSTGNATVDAIYNAYIASVNSPSLQPNCVYRQGDICYIN